MRFKRVSFTNFLWALLCIGVMFGAMRAFSHEYRSAVMVRSLDADVIESLRGIETDSLPVTFGGLRELFEQCTALLLSNNRLRLDLALAGEVAASCTAAADAALAENPSFARAHTAKLVATAQSFTADEYGRAMTSAPYEPWPLSTRLLAVERRLATATLDEDLAALVAQDIDRAARTPWGRQILATLYLRRDALQGLIQERLETRPETEQAAFLRVLRQLTNR